MMDLRMNRTKSRSGSKSSSNMGNSFSAFHHEANTIAIKESFPCLINAWRWFSPSYLHKRNETVPLLSGSSTPMKNTIYGSCPWRPPDKCYDSRPIMALHEEIDDFYNYISPTTEEHAARRAVIRNIESVIIELWPSARIQVIGSFRTGLYLPSSDINLLVVGSWPRLPLKTLQDVLSKKGVCVEGGSICVFKRGQEPVLILTDKLFDFKIQLSFSSKGGPQFAELIKHYKAKYPPLVKLALVLKQFLYQRDLQEVILGGVSYYGLLMMIVSFLQLHPRLNATTSHVNLGVLLMEFFELYGRKFNYSLATINTKRGGSYIPKNKFPANSRRGRQSSMLCIEDPLNPIIDLGYNSLKVRNAFTLAFANLNMAMNGVSEIDDFLPQESILGRIVRVSHDLISQRQKIRNNFQVMSSATNGLNINSDSE